MAFSTPGVSASRRQSLPFDDLKMLDGGAEYDGRGRLRYMWYHLQVNGSRYFKVVKLRVLSYLPRVNRQRASLPEVMRKCLKGLYDARADMVYIAAGMFTEPNVGIVQMYGAQGMGNSLEEARERAEAGMAGVLATLKAGFPQSLYEPLTLEMARWLQEAFERLPCALVMRGHPDPREASRSVPQEPYERGRGDPEEIGLQQNELLFRGMAARREEFLWVVLISRLASYDDVFASIEARAHELSIWRSRVNFTRSIGASLAIPLSLMQVLASGATTGYATANAENLSRARAETLGYAHTESRAHSVAQGVAHTHTESHQVAETTGISRSVVRSTGEARGTSKVHTEGQTWGTADTRGTADTTGEAHTRGSATSTTTSVTHVPQIVTRHESETRVPQITVTSESTTEIPEVKAHHEGATKVPEITSTSESTTHVPEITSKYSGQASSVNVSLNRPAPTVARPEAKPEVVQQVLEHGINWDGSPQSAPSGNSGGTGGGDALGLGGVHPPAASPAPALTGSPQGAKPSDLVGLPGTVEIPGGTTNMGGGVGVPGVSISGGESTPKNPTVSLNLGGGTRTEAAGWGVTMSGGTTSTDGTTTTPAHDISSEGTTTTPAHEISSEGTTTTPAHEVKSTGSATTPAHMVKSSGVTVTPAHTVRTTTTSRSSFSSHTTMHSHTEMRSHTDMHSRSVADARGVSFTRSKGIARGVSRFHSVTVARGIADSVTKSRVETETTGTADTTSRTTTNAMGRGWSVGTTRAQALTAAQSLAFGLGVVPGLSFGKTYQGYDAVAAKVAEAIEGQIRLLQTISLEGGAFVDSYFLVKDPKGRATLKALIPQAFHGTQDVVVPVHVLDLSPEEEKYIRTHAFFLVPSTMPEKSRWALEPYRHSTLMTLLQAGTLVSPAVFEHGYANTVAEPIPQFLLQPPTREDKEKGILLGIYWSTETNELAAIPLYLRPEEMSNFAACADTRYGKSVALERLVYEAVKKWGFRAVVLDFGLGWRKLMRLIPPEQFDLYGLYPESPRPIRWNFLQVGRRVSPAEQLAATVELVANAGRMGEKQRSLLRDTLYQLYVEHGVLVNDAMVYRDEKWSRVSDEEREAINRERETRGLPPRTERELYLADLEWWEKQVVAIERSKQVDVVMWLERIDALRRKYPDRSSTRESLEGIYLRMLAFSPDPVAKMFGKGEGSIAVEDLAYPRGLSVIEGGRVTNDFLKAVVLSLMGWRLYQDAVARKNIVGNEEQPKMIILYEEGNKVLGGIPGTIGADRPVASQIIKDMFRDAGKYDIYLGVVAQSPSELPKGVLSSCNLLFAGQLKDADDVKAVVTAMARSPHGFIDVPYVRFQSSLAQGQFLVKIGLTQVREKIFPRLIRPLMVQATLPSDREVADYFRFRK